MLPSAVHLLNVFNGSLSAFRESFEVGRALSHSPDDHKPRPKEESVELNSCCSVRGDV